MRLRTRRACRARRTRVHTLFVRENMCASTIALFYCSCSKRCGLFCREGSACVADFGHPRTAVVLLTTSMRLALVARNRGINHRRATRRSLIVLWATVLLSPLGSVAGYFRCSRQTAGTIFLAHLSPPFFALMCASDVRRLRIRTPRAEVSRRRHAVASSVPAEARGDGSRDGRRGGSERRGTSRRAIRRAEGMCGACC